MGSEHPDTMASVADLALAYLSQGKFTESDPLAREAMEFDRKKQPDDWQGFGPKACWAPAWLDRRNTPRPNRCRWKATRECRHGRTEWQSRIGITWIAPANGLGVGQAGEGRRVEEEARLRNG